MQMKKDWLSATALILALAGMADAGWDNRFRVYHKGYLNPSVLKDPQAGGHPKFGARIPFRSGGSGYVANSDIISVGKVDVDQSPIGSEAGEGLRKFHFLKSWESEVPTQFESNGYFLWSAAGGSPIMMYQEVVERIPKYMTPFLMPTLFIGMQDIVRLVPTSQHYPYRTVIKALGVSDQYLSKEAVLNRVFDQECGRIAEGPNAGKCQGIMNYVAAWKNSRGSAAPVFEIANEPNVFPYISPDQYAWYYLKWHAEIKKVAPDALVMPGGLWIFEGLPNDVLNKLHYVEIKMVNTRNYLETFLSSLESRSGKPSRDLVDIGNLHFYPYVGTQRSYETIEQHFQNLASLAGFLGGKVSTGKVWLTEMGNISPLSPLVTSAFMEITMTKLVALSDQQKVIERWYWFEGAGEDSKLDFLGDKWIKNPITLAFARSYAVLDASLVAVQPYPFKSMVGILDAILGTNYEAQMNGGTMGFVLYDYLAGNVYQGLLNEEETQLRPHGRKFLDMGWKRDNLNPIYTLLLQ